MSAASVTNERDTFDAVAADYHAVRPAYPSQLFSDLADAIGDRARILEVGCGSGQATRGLLEQGWDVVAVDPGAELIALAKDSLSGRVAFHVARFEDFTPEPASFQLVASAQAWHWVDPAVGFAKAAAALGPGGSLAVFGHVPMPPPRDVVARLAPVYAEIAPELWDRVPPETWYLPEGPVPALFDASGLFGVVAHKAYPWSERSSGRALARQLSTRSYYNVLEGDRRERLLAEIEAALAPLGDFVLQHETHLYRASVLS
ncbi:MAG: class I SAM-dependent methyltransferase [Phenylobacterium sp.]|nr:class I SAM-dependent methyltransferase [Phenylobacterium sp.]